MEIVIATDPDRENLIAEVREGSYSWADVRYESLRMLRSPGMSIPFLLMPVPIYLFFGVMMAGEAVAGNPELANYLFSGWSVFAVMGPALFGPGCTLAVERETGVLTLRRAMPAPPGAIVSKPIPMP